MKLKFIDNESEARMMFYTLPDFTIGYDQNIALEKRRVCYDTVAKRYYLRLEAFGLNNADLILSETDVDAHSCFMKSEDAWYFDMRWVIEQKLITEKASEELRTYFLSLQNHYITQMS